MNAASFDIRRKWSQCGGCQKEQDAKEGAFRSHITPHFSVTLEGRGY